MLGLVKYIYHRLQDKLSAHKLKQHCDKALDKTMIDNIFKNGMLREELMSYVVVHQLEPDSTYLLLDCALQWCKSLCDSTACKHCFMYQLKAYYKITYEDGQYKYIGRKSAQ